MAKGKGKRFGKAGGGSDGFSNKVVKSPMSAKMLPKGGKMAGGGKY